MKKNHLQADTLNYLGFTTRKLGDYEKGEEILLTRSYKLSPIIME